MDMLVDLDIVATKIYLKDIIFFKVLNSEANFTMGGSDLVIREIWFTLLIQRSTPKNKTHGVISRYLP